jgi:hypothetical protein
MTISLTSPLPFKNRIFFLDIARGLAITLSLLIHTLYSLKIWETLNVPSKRLLAVLTQTATPCFVLLFGIMLELIYYRKITEGQSLKKISGRILQRSLWCYLGYTLTVAAEILIGEKNLSEGFFSFLFLGNTPYGGILKFWTIALILAIPLLRLRWKKGLTAVFTLSLSLWIFVPLLDQIAWPDHANLFSYWTGIFFGRPSNRALISLLHTLVFIVIGMILGERLSSQDKEEHWRGFQKVVAVFICVDLVIVLCLMFFYSPGQLLAGYTTIFRKTHHLAYYCLSFLEAFGLLFILSWLFPFSKSRISKIFSPLMMLGRHSLPAFVLGNIFITLCPKPANPSLFTGFAYFGLIVLLVTLLLMAKEHFFSGKKKPIPLHS